MSEHDLLRAIAQHERAAQRFLLERHCTNGEQLYRRCRTQYFLLQTQWHLYRTTCTTPTELAEEYEIATYLQSTVRQEYHRTSEAHRMGLRGCP